MFFYRKSLLLLPVLAIQEQVGRHTRTHTHTLFRSLCCGHSHPSTVERYINWTLNHIKSKAKNIKYIGRSPMASTATGYLKKHVAQQQEIVTKALTING